MKCALIILVVLAFIGLSYAAPAEPRQNVSFLKYSNDQELEDIMRQIIAQYDHLGGTSQFHNVQSASVIDPHTLKINV